MEPYPPELARLTAAPPGAYTTVHYGASPEQYGEYWPASGDTLVLLIHGGYWHARYRLDLMHRLAADLVARGYPVWNVEYRRIGTPGGGWPGTFDDIAAALAGAPGHPARVVVVGHSAGGHLALWAGGREPRPDLVVSLAGVCDLYRAVELRLSNDAVVELLGGTPADRPEIYERANPAPTAPQLLVHGTADDHVPYEVSEYYAGPAGVPLLRLDGVDHFAVIDPDSAAWATIAGEISRRVPAGGRTGSPR